MLDVVACLDEAALWGLAAGEPLDEAAAAHGRECPRCQRRAVRLREQQRIVRRSAATNIAEGPVPDRIVEPNAVPHLDSPPDQIGRYAVRRRLAISGQADVYLCRHPTLSCDVVVKWARRTVSARPVLRAAIAHEGRVLAAIQHPALTRVLDLDFHDDRPYLVLEHVDGRTLRATVAALRPDVPQIIDWLLQVVAAIEAAHRHEVLHLDLKPDNVLVHADGRLRVIDFGTAGLLLACHEACETPCLLGTIDYMAPEQHTGEPEQLQPATDVYGLGGLLYFLLFGEGPHAGGRRLPTFQPAGTPEWPTAGAEPTGRTGTVDADLLTVCRRALDPVPGQRYGSVTEFAGALQRVRTARRRDRLRRWIAMALIVMGMACHLAALGWPSAGESQLQLHAFVRHDDARQPLAAHSPLQPGDRLQLQIDTLAPERTQLFLILGGRKVIPCVPLSAAPERPGTLCYPVREPDWIVGELADCNLLLTVVVGENSRLSPAELRAIWVDTEWRLPPGCDAIELCDDVSRPELRAQFESTIAGWTDVALRNSVLNIAHTLDEREVQYSGILFRGVRTPP